MALHERLVWLAFFLSGLLVGVSLLIYDELLTLAIYSPGSGYPYPGLGVMTLYQASYFPFGGIILAFIIVTLTCRHAHASTEGTGQCLDTGPQEQPEISDGKKTSDTSNTS